MGTRHDLYGLSIEWCKLLGDLEEQQGGIDPETEERLDALTLATPDAVEQWAGAVKYLEAHAAEARAEAERLKARADALSQRAARLKEQLGAVMDLADLPKYKGSRYNVNRQQGRAVVEVVDESQIPGEYLTIVPPRPNKKALLEELKLGLSVPGARLATGRPSVRIA